MLKLLTLIFRIAAWAAFLVFIGLFFFGSHRYISIFKYTSFFCIAIAVLLTLFQVFRKEISGDKGE